MTDKPRNIYAIKCGDEWSFATMAFNKDYNLEPGHKMVWSDLNTTGYICPIGEEQESMIIEERESK